MTDKLIEGKVAQIVSETQLIVNVGRSHGVREGMKFQVLADTPLEVKDPDTGEIIDTYDREKVKVQAFDIREKIAICATYETTTIGGGLGWGLRRGLGGSLLDDSPPRTVTKTLKISDASFPRPLTPEESYVKIGDRVRQLVEPRSE